MGMANKDTGALASYASSSGAINGADQDGVNATGIIVYIYVSAITGTSPTLTVTLQGKSPVSGQYYTILQSAAITSTGMTVLRVYPGMTAVANVSANDILPPVFRITTATGGTSPVVTATISSSLIF